MMTENSFSTIAQFFAHASADMVQLSAL